MHISMPAPIEITQQTIPLSTKKKRKQKKQKEPPKINLIYTYSIPNLPIRYTGTNLHTNIYPSFIRIFPGPTLPIITVGDVNPQKKTPRKKAKSKEEEEERKRSRLWYVSNQKTPFSISFIDSQTSINK